jgi:sugar O-acyltransferase (sialic acid O-acetyltransferase NeuD family)
MKQPIVVFGVGDYAEVVTAYLDYDSSYEVVAFTVNQSYITTETLLNRPVVPFETLTEQYPPTQFKAFIAMGYSRVNQNRTALFEQFQSLGYSLISYISSHAVNIAQLPVGANTFIFEGVILQPYARIGNNVTIWSNSLIAHHSQIGDHCFIAHNVAISGHVQIEPYCFIGGNATIRDRVTVRTRGVIGAGAVILEDTEPDGVYKSAQTPALPIPSHQLHRI